jgi:RNA polymerase sigma-70 factor, ECF subfamily
LPNRRRESLFRQWLDEHQPILLKVARAYADSREDQDDVVQEMLLQLWRSIPSYQGNAKPSTWIYRVALNTSIAWKRSETRRRHRQRVLADADCLPDRRSDQCDAEENHAAVERLYIAIRQLAAVDRSLVLLHLDGLSYREMSEILGITESNVGVKLNRIKKQLLELLGGPSHES